MNAIPPHVNWTRTPIQSVQSRGWNRPHGHAIGPVRIVSTFKGGRQKECIHHKLLTDDCLGCYVKCSFQYCVWRTAL